MNCIFCGGSFNKTFRGIGDVHKYDCESCGTYYLGDYISRILYQTLSAEKRREIASLLYERKIRNKKPVFFILRDQDTEMQGAELTEVMQTDVSFFRSDELIYQYPKNILERLDRILLNLSEITEFPGSKIKIEKKDASLFYQDSENLNETFFIMQQLIDDGLIKGSSGFPTDLVITVKGWNKVYELEKNNNSESKQAFVAMNFDSEYLDIYKDGITKAIEQCGYNPYRVDQDLKVEMIDDKIIAEIKRSRFVIADCTGDKKGVYFEAGLAFGLSLPVIWMVKDGHTKDLHFDTRQFAHIVWKDKNDLINKLTDKINAVIE